MGRELRELQSVQTQLGTYLQAASELQQRADQLIGQRTLAQTLQNNQKQLLNLNSELDRTTAQQEQVLSLLSKTSGRLTFGSAVELYTDLEVTLEQANKAFQAWRKIKAVFDLNAALENFAKEGEEGLTQPQGQAQVDAAEKEYLVALGMADALAPKPVTSSLIEIAG